MREYRKNPLNKIKNKIYKENYKKKNDARTFMKIRPIKPQKIVRWINVKASGEPVRRSWETKEEAQLAASRSGHNDWKQVKLEGEC